MRSRAFTLAELLIALTVLGIVATFTIPKLLTSQADQQKKAIFKETLASMSDILYTGFMAGDITQATGSYFRGRMNSSKICTSNSSTEGCWPQASPNAENVEPGLILHNGATITGLNDPNSPTNGFNIDWNGATGPNVEGDDQMALIICASKTDCSTSYRALRIRPSSTASNNLYNSVFQ